MKLLVSPINREEAVIASNGGADIVDVKNPKEGSLGANFPWVIREVKEAVNGRQPISATIGDFNYKPGTASLAALGAAVAGADYIKVGLYDIQTEAQALELLTRITEAVKDYDPTKKVVASGYSDYKRINSISPMLLPAVAAEAGADVVMVDTGVKDGKSTFEFMDEKELTMFAELAHEHGLEVAIAGSLKFEDLPVLERIGPDIIGVRGMVCGGDRSTVIRQELVEKLVSECQA
ncbi:(5-formylfuran-3-yl)methyl phosphate synthase [Methanosarcina sp. KYL-1]|uniref:(5-formylfuran-3-yl)methyl phosphate synthase n=1 Tax=Methanosarcina sp. KYL-1 TaxID=2602068 RepID=UPI0021018F15|nr:(5-formylfuran-3-yl)methyl phosphate synthase [Methanosarcina sp. KYL-1]MCQ1535117.1 (5-formylfuran-3-yl)methyl phosphate synthase [Methanosarcina sp. KYL-1]